eukprot:TRINITY_DN13073_c0_g1_i1.p1 TRINITY_DN13073_c0_g1~~TRINITY_DN13073_c0_g1_i1.p1  ORF type:complete len:685 (+),score=169.74 TRINITY_DN13073_c0_g1_i1:122-2176(+)
MKFGKQLESTMVVEWQEMYLDYKRLKELLKYYKRKEKLKDDETTLDDKDPDEFLNEVETELDKINNFYMEKEEQMLERFEAVKENLNELPNLENNDVDLSESLNDTRLTLFQMRERKIIKQKKILKKAMIQIYRACLMLENFCQLNYTGCYKIVKKYDKITKSRELEQFLEHCRDKEFYNHSALKDLKELVLNLFTENFVDETINPKKATNLAKRELTKRRHDDRDKDMLVLGLFAGSTLAFVFLFFFLMIDNHSTFHININDFLVILPVLRLGFIPILAVWAWGFDIFILHRARINYVFIFEFDQATTLTYVQVLRLAGGLSIIFMTFFYFTYASIGGYYLIPGWDDVTSLQVFPLIILVLLFCVLFNPFNFNFRKSRIKLLLTIFQVIITPFGRINFLEFFIGDVLTSLVKTIQDLTYSSCYYATLDFIQVSSDRCDGFNSVLAPITSILPMAWRFMQCIKRYIYTRKIEHLPNAGKYGFGFSVVLFSYLAGHGEFQVYNEEWSPLRIIWLICFICSTLYMYTWDLFMDWGLGRVKSKNFFLRDKLIFKDRKWFYYYCMVSNFFFRFFWTITITQFPLDIGIQPEVLNLLAASIEIIRRFTWAILRIENEHLHNCGNFRAIDFVPLPFDRNKSTGETVEEEEELTNEQIMYNQSHSIKDYNEIKNVPYQSINNDDLITLKIT